MAQTTDKVIYSEMSVDEELTGFSSGKKMKTHRPPKRSSWSSTLANNRMKILCTSLVLVSIVAGLLVYSASSKSSSTKDINEDDDQVDAVPQLRSYTRSETRRLPADMGRMSVYMNNDNRRSYRKYDFPVARYSRQHNPLRGPFLNFMPWVPIFADRFTKQTIIYSPTGLYILPPLVNTYGHLFSVAQLLASGYASLVGSGSSLYGNIDMLRYFQPLPLLGPGIPAISPITGGFGSAMRGDFGTFRKARNYRSRPNIEYPREKYDDSGDDNNHYPEREREDDNYGPYPNSYEDNRPQKTKRPPRRTTTTRAGNPATTTSSTTSSSTSSTTSSSTSSTSSSSTSSTSSTTVPPDSVPACQSNAKARTPFTIIPFQDEFKNPPVHVPLSRECRKDNHCMFSYSVDVFDTRLSPFNNIIPACASKPGTIFITYNGSVPGPTFILPAGHEALVRFNNKIENFFKDSFSPCTGTRTGRPIGIHHHGSASIAPYDGWADDETCLHETKEYVYPDNRPAMEWYHDHALHITAENAYYGLAGLYIVSSKKKYGGCGEPWNLEDIEEKFLILQDKVLDSECQLVIDKDKVDKVSFYGDINLVSGIPYPYMNLDPKWYRFRFLNAAVSRPYDISIKNSALQDISQDICHVIAADAGYRREPLTFPADGLLIGVAERYEIVCDFSAYAGQTLYLWNGINEKYMKDVEYFCYSHYVAKLIISTNTDPTAAKFDGGLTSIVPEKPVERVLTSADIDAAQKLIEDDQPHRTMVFERRRNQWVINGETWDSAKIAAKDVGQNTWELWLFRTGGGWFHPVHVHLVDFYILLRDRDGGVKPYEQLSPKDILYLGPSQDIYVIVRFGPHKGDYMFHCHNLIHEDDDMMRAFAVINSTDGENPTSAQPFLRNNLTNIVYANWKYSDPMLTELSAKSTLQMPTLNETYLQKMLTTNIYRIFYPVVPDDNELNGNSNPWRSQWCTLPPT